MVFVSSRNKRKKVTCVVDTGYDGFLALPVHVVRKLSYQMIDIQRAELADGSTAVFEIYEGFIQWFGKKTRIAVDATPAKTALLGMGIMTNCRLTIEPAKNLVTITKRVRQLGIVRKTR